MVLLKGTFGKGDFGSIGKLLYVPFEAPFATLVDEGMGIPADQTLLCHKAHCVYWRHGHHERLDDFALRMWTYAHLAGLGND